MSVDSLISEDQEHEEVPKVENIEVEMNDPLEFPSPNPEISNEESPKEFSRPHLWIPSTSHFKKKTVMYILWRIRREQGGQPGKGRPITKVKRLIHQPLIGLGHTLLWLEWQRSNHDRKKMRILC